MNPFVFSESAASLPKSLKFLNLMGDSSLTHLPVALGALKSLEELNCTDCPITNIPEELLKGHWDKDRGKGVIRYLRDVLQGSEPSFAANVMLVGLGGVGKTALAALALPMQGILSERAARIDANQILVVGDQRISLPGTRAAAQGKLEIKITPGDHVFTCPTTAARRDWLCALERAGRETASTHGIDIYTSSIVADDLSALGLPVPQPLKSKTLEVTVKDFAGQEEYLAGHVAFLGPRCVVVVVWDASADHKPLTLKAGDALRHLDPALKGRELSLAELSFWLSSVQARVGIAHTVAVLVVANKIDRAPQGETPADRKLVVEQAARKCGFTLPFTVLEACCIPGRDAAGIAAVRKAVLGAVLNLSHVGAAVPVAYANLAVQLRSLRAEREALPLASVDELVAANPHIKPSTPDEGPQHLIRRALEMVHHWGAVCLYRAAVPNLVVLDPQWLAKCIGDVLRFAATVTPRGILSHAMLRQLGGSPWAAMSVKQAEEVWDLLRNLALVFVQPTKEIQPWEKQTSFVPDALSPTKAQVPPTPPGHRVHEVWVELSRQLPTSSVLGHVLHRADGRGANPVPELCSLTVVAVTRDEHRGFVAADPVAKMIHIRTTGPDAKLHTLLLNLVREVMEEMFPGVAATEKYACPACRASQQPHELPERLETEAELRDRAQDGKLHCLSTIAHQLDVARLFPVEDEGRPAASSGTGQWIALSYQWDSKARVLRIKAALEAAGYRVWIDEEQMSGNMNARMAEAVDGGAAVVVCVTEKYKRSHNCMLEINYANDRRKCIIPLVLDEAQKKLENRTGPVWLILAGKIWYDFSTDDIFDASLRTLLNAPRDGLPKEARNTQVPSPAPDPAPVPVPDPAPKPAPNPPKPEKPKKPMPSPLAPAPAPELAPKAKPELPKPEPASTPAPTLARTAVPLSHVPVPPASIPGTDVDVSEYNAQARISQTCSICLEAPSSLGPVCAICAKLLPTRRLECAVGAFAILCLGCSPASGALRELVRIASAQFGAAWVSKSPVGLSAEEKMEVRALRLAIQRIYEADDATNAAFVVKTDTAFSELLREARSLLRLALRPEASAAAVETPVDVASVEEITSVLKQLGLQDEVVEKAKARHLTLSDLAFKVDHRCFCELGVPKKLRANLQIPRHCSPILVWNVCEYLGVHERSEDFKQWWNQVVHEETFVFASEDASMSRLIQQTDVDASDVATVLAALVAFSESRLLMSPALFAAALVFFQVLRIAREIIYDKRGKPRTQEGTHEEQIKAQLSGRYQLLQQVYRDPCFVELKKVNHFRNTVARHDATLKSEINEYADTLDQAHQLYTQSGGRQSLEDIMLECKVTDSLSNLGQLLHIVDTSFLKQRKQRNPAQKAVRLVKLLEQYPVLLEVPNIVLKVCGLWLPLNAKDQRQVGGWSEVPDTPDGLVDWAVHILGSANEGGSK
eukprot:TRINITY_DN1345_c0_g1_i11.p1 TRINITY_DN1345_c0_g1~~TRINITY_DN1345_c0_g1_i11.p1  ORF type:complete len:1438 (-),score=269.55 TRINITY_DN1345_c0_g1_i11:6-4319(-)